MSANSSFKNHKIPHLNHLMDNIHDSCNDLYESMIDREYTEAKKKIQELIKGLEGIMHSMEDEI